MTQLQTALAADRELIERALCSLFQGRSPHGDIYDAMNYSLLAGGKRLRPTLTLECCRLFGGVDSAALSLACAVEMIHTYSLIHDDLPCMDNDDLRRGKPTNHKVYGEATAVLAGDGLLTWAFEVALDAAAYLPAPRVVEATQLLARAAGAAGMVGGQVLDMAGDGQILTREQVEELQQLKTGALIAAAAELGCIAAGGNEAQRAAVRTYAQKLGLAFQVRDDILDVTADTATLGKPVGSDQAQGKTTFVDLLGLEECQRWVEQLSREACSALEPYPGSELLQALAKELARRSH